MYRVVIEDLDGYEYSSEWSGDLMYSIVRTGMMNDFSSITIEYGGEQLDGI